MKLPLATLFTAMLAAQFAAAPAFAAEDEAHRIDRLRIRQMNRDAAATFAKRDRAMAQDNRRSAARYEAGRARYDRAMAEWRRRVAACNAGDYSACDR